MIISALFVLCSCKTFSNRAALDASRVTEFYKALGNANFRVAISADFPERVSEYKVSYEYNKDAASTITILEPASVSDVKVTVDAGETTLVYEGARLETGKLNQAGISPLSILPCLLKTWAVGDISEIEAVKREDTDSLLIVYRNRVEEEDLVYRSWFDRSDCTPLFAELLVNGTCVIRCEFEQTKI